MSISNSNFTQIIERFDHKNLAVSFPPHPFADEDLCGILLLMLI